MLEGELRVLRLAHLLGGVRTPALVVWGDDDRIVPRSAADAYMRALPSARLEIVPACGHLVDMEKPDELARYREGLEYLRDVVLNTRASAKRIEEIRDGHVALS